jgi:hypothetical protein
MAERCRSAQRVSFLLISSPMSEAWRQLTERERAIIDRLMESAFSGRDEILIQLDHCLVRFWRGCEEHCGSLEFQVNSDRLIPGSRSSDTPIPVEGQAFDADGLPIDVLLFHRDGRLKHLEFVIYGNQIRRQPVAEDLTVTLHPTLICCCKELSIRLICHVSHVACLWLPPPGESIKQTGGGWLEALLYFLSRSWRPESAA